ncbi:unnamed protein product [Rotaria sordida]|nr:unnamed protein product [Rotaria sordida]CAF1056867.1 unnamed protein product [Rotaria sordida]
MGNRFVAKNANSNALTDEEIADLQKISNLSFDDIKNNYKAFLEDNPSGRMDKKRFIHWYDLLKPDFDIKDEVACENAFAAFDKNKDGTIDFKEFTTALAFLRPNTVEAHVDLFFQMYDVSGDGCLDCQELIDAFESIIYLLALGKKTTPKSAKQMASEVFVMFGLNEDAKITKEQFIEG